MESITAKDEKPSSGAIPTDASSAPTVPAVAGEPVIPLVEGSTDKTTVRQEMNAFQQGQNVVNQQLQEALAALSTVMTGLASNVLSLHAIAQEQTRKLVIAEEERKAFADANSKDARRRALSPGASRKRSASVAEESKTDVNASEDPNQPDDGDDTADPQQLHDLLDPTESSFMAEDVTRWSKANPMASNGPLAASDFNAAGSFGNESMIYSDQQQRSQQNQQASQSPPRSNRDQSNDDTRRRPATFSARSRTPEAAFEQGRSDAEVRREELHKLKQLDKTVKPNFSQSAGGTFGSFANSVLIRNVRLAAQASAALQDLQATRSGVVLVGTPFAHKAIYRLNVYILLEFVKKCIEHDSRLENPKCQPGKFLSQALKKAIVSRIRVLSRKGAVLKDIGSGPIGIPTTEMLSKAFLSEFFLYACQGLVAVTTQECIASLTDSFASFDAAYGIAPGEVLGLQDRDVFEDYFDERTKFAVKTMEVYPQFSAQPNEDGSLRLASTFPGIKPDREKGTKSWLGIFYTGAAFPQVFLPDGSVDPSALSLKRVFLTDSADQFVATSRDKTIDYDVMYQLGQHAALLDTYNENRKATASFDTVFSGTKGPVSGTPMLHQELALSPAHHSKVMVNPQHAPKPARADVIAPLARPPDNRLTPYQKSDSQRQETARMLRQQHAHGEKPTPPFWPSKRARAPSDDAPRPNTMLGMMEMYDSERQEEEEYQRLCNQYEQDMDDYNYLYKIGPYAPADDTEDSGYMTANEGSGHEARDEVLIRELKHAYDLRHLDQREAQRPSPEDANRAVMEQLATLSVSAISALPVAIREHVADYRERNDSQQWQSQRNSGSHNPGRVVEKRVAFEPRPRGVCGQFLVGKCKHSHDGVNGCPWSHAKADVRARVAEINASQATRDALDAQDQPKPASRVVVAAVSGAKNRLQTDPAPGVFPRREGSSADNVQQE